jgi:FkbM family methyltransferase
MPVPSPVPSQQASNLAPAKAAARAVGIERQSPATGAAYHESGILIDEEQQLVCEFFAGMPGFFVEVGANDPFASSQSWHLEQCGWSGVLVEPQPKLAHELALVRSAKVFAAACSSPRNVGRRAPFYVAGAMSSLDRDRMAPGSKVQEVIEVSIRILDDILVEAGAPQPIDFLSIDVEGPQLILLEDHVGDLSKHRFMKSIGYRLVRRTGYNGWYVPRGSTIRFGWKDRLEVLRKYYYALPFRVLRNISRHPRQPFKDKRRANRP